MLQKSSTCFSAGMYSVQMCLVIKISWFHYSPMILIVVTSMVQSAILLCECHCFVCQFFGFEVPWQAYISLNTIMSNNLVVQKVTGLPILSMQCLIHLLEWQSDNWSFSWLHYKSGQIYNIMELVQHIQWHYAMY